ncbi:hypothetical protein ABZ586_03930, partial [Streptomyces misionensis]
TPKDTTDEEKQTPKDTTDGQKPTPKDTTDEEKQTPKDTTDEEKQDLKDTPEHKQRPPKDSAQKQQEREPEPQREENQAEEPKQDRKADGSEVTSSAPPAPPRLKVPGDGRCLLYSVLASTPPEHWPTALHNGTPQDARALHEAVLQQIGTRQQTAVDPHSPLGRAAGNLHRMVLDGLRSTPPHELPREVAEVYRRVQVDRLQRQLRTESPEELRARLGRYGVDRVMSPDWLHPRALRALYIEARTRELTGEPHHLSPRDAAEAAAAEVPETTNKLGHWVLHDDALAPHAQFDHLTAHGGPLSLDHIDSKEALVDAVVDTSLHQPLTPAEHQALVRAVENWVPGNDAWNTDEGEVFPALVAHTLGTRLRTFRMLPDGTTSMETTGPGHTGRTVDVHYDGRSHYDAAQLPPRRTTTTAADDEVAPRAPKAPGSTTGTAAPRRPHDQAPRFVVRSAFDARVFRAGDTAVTDLTVRVAFRGSEHDPETAWERLVQGTEEFYNAPGHRLPDGSRLHVTVERVAADDRPHLVVDLAGHDRPMDQHTWWPDAEPVAYAHELGHQLGLRDEYRQNDGEGPGRAGVAGSLLGDFHRPAPDGLAQGGLRGRHLQLLGALVGDVPETVVRPGTDAPHSAFGPQDPRWQEARATAPPVTRRHVWVDPVTDPGRHDGEREERTQDPRMPQGVHERSGQENSEDVDYAEILAEYTEERRREYDWLDQLYGDSLDQDAYDRVHNALLTLQSMDLAHITPDAEHRPPIEVLAERMLRLDGTPTAQDYRDLLELTALAGPEARRDAAALGAHILATTHQALDQHTVLGDGAGHAMGRDWTASRTVPADLTRYTTTGSDGEQTQHTAPWRSPYVAAADRAPDGLALRLNDRTVHVSEAEFAELVARDPLRGADQDIVLVVSNGQDRELARLVADRAGAAVWSTDSRVHPVLDWRTGDELLDLTGGSGGWALHLGGPRGPLDLFDFDFGSPTPEHEAPTPEHEPAGPDYASKLRPHPGGHESALAPANLLDRLRARPLTTSDYEVIGADPHTVLFEEPTGMNYTTFTYGRSRDVPRLWVPSQGHQQTLVGDHPPLHVSQDLSLAHREGGYGQQVFATPKAIEASNHQLALAGSLVRLEAGDLTLRVADGQGGHRELVRVTPRFLTRSGKSEEEICRDFAQMVSGGAPASHVVFRGPDGSSLDKAPINALGRTEVTGIHHLAESLSLVADGERPTGPLGPSWAVDQVRRDDRLIAESDGPTPGKSYGSALSYDPLVNPRRDALSDAARQIGINEHAWAKVGEAYLVHSINALDENGLPSLAHNYAKPGEPEGSHFGYHFAAVVLSSEDGRHQITLENFARRAHVASIVKTAVSETLRHGTPDGFRKLHRAVTAELDRVRSGGADEAQIKRLERHLSLVDALTRTADARQKVDGAAPGTPEHASAAAEFDKALKAAEARMKQASELAKGSDLWHFRMFSQRPGETMHEVSADLLTSDRSAEANPLTAVIVHGHRLPKIDIGFREGSRQIGKDEGRKLNYVAELATRTGLWNHHNGLPLPRITVTGRGNTRRPTLGGVLPDAAQQRAQAVHGELRDRLDRYLINYQHGSPRQRLTAADFPVTVTTERPSRGGDQEQGRRTTVAVHDARSDHSEVSPRAPRRQQTPTESRTPAQARTRTQDQTHTQTQTQTQAQPQPEVASPVVPHAAPSVAPYRSERLTIGGVEFADGSSEPTGAQRETVHRLAAEVAWASLANVRAGFPPPRVTVVGHANGMRGGLPHFGEALRRGQARADGVADLFRSALAVHLERLGAGEEAVTRLADIEVTARSEGNTPPGDGTAGLDPATALRHAFVVVELPRPADGAA